MPTRVRPLPPTARRFTVPVRIYYQDTDTGGVVYHARYLDYFERARMEWLRAIGFEARALSAQYSVMFVVRSIVVDYLVPGQLDDLLESTLGVVQAGAALLKLNQSILREAQTLVNAEVDLACVDAQQFRPTRLPDALRDEVSRWVTVEHNSLTA
jgi:acyl-CoA thioester hydrolase